MTEAKWRLLYLDAVDPFEMSSYEEVFSKARSLNLIPNSLIALRVSKPTAAVGQSASIKYWVNQKFCEENDVTIIRGFRQPAGISNYFGSENLLCWLVRDRLGSVDKWSISRFKKCVVHTLQILGLESTAKGTRNDVQVGGKKVSSIGIFSNSKRDIWIYTLDLFLGFNFEIAEQATVSKHKEPMHEKMSTIQVEAGRNISFEELIDALKEAFKEEFNVEFDISYELSDAENEIVDSLREKYTSKSWIELGKWSQIKEYWRH